MFTRRKKKKPSVRFFSLVPAVNTLYPIISSKFLNRDWITEEQADYQERKSKCPMAKIFNLSRGYTGEVHSINNCPAIHSIMNHGLIVRNCADVVVSTTDGTINIQAPSLVHGTSYATLHEEIVSKWLIDPGYNARNNILKINTPWRVTAEEDIVFLVTKVPFVNESRFSAVQGILDPKIAYEVNIQLFWHETEGSTVIEAGTPLAQYIPISRKLLHGLSFTSEQATESDYRCEQEMNFVYDHTQPYTSSMKNKLSRVLKVLKKYYD